MEPERKIEQWLRAFAKKRRNQAPDDPGFALHPATRRQLQDAVRQRFPSPGQKPASFRQFFRQISFRPIEVLVVVVFIALMAALWLPSLTKAKTKALSLSAVSNLKQIGRAARLYAGDNEDRLPLSYGAMTNYLPGDAATIDPVSGKPFIYVGGGQLLKNLKPAEAVLAYSPTDKRSRAVLFADGRVELATGKRFVELTNRGLVQLARADLPALHGPAEPPGTPLPAAAPMVVAPPAVAAAPDAVAATEAERLSQPAATREISKGADLGIEPARAEAAQNEPLAAKAKAGLAEPGKTPAARREEVAGLTAGQTNLPAWAGGSSRKFVRTDVASSVQYGFKRDAVSGKVPPVLASFQLQQSGGELRVVDGDGSVYRGQLLPRDAAVKSGVPDESGKLMNGESQSLRGERTASSPAREKEVPEGKGAEPMAQSYFFQVAGTNQTLRQALVFTGTLLVRNATGGYFLPGGVNGIAASNSWGGSGGGGGGGGSFDTLALPGSRSSMRISGTAVIAGTNQIEINAVPGMP
jgi:type II secretory pathway pseudopilin PulG